MLEPDKKYLSIREVSERTDVPPYTLRYWEKEFIQLKPERHSGMRKYSQEDVYLIKKIKTLLYDEKFTIDGVKKYLKVDRRKKTNSDILHKEPEISLSRKDIFEITKEIEEVLDLLEN